MIYENFIVQSVLSMILCLSELYPHRELTIVTYETEFECGDLIKRLRTVSNHFRSTSGGILNMASLRSLDIAM